jgi:hypothetical protein
LYRSLSFPSTPSSAHPAQPSVTNTSVARPHQVNSTSDTHLDQSVQSPCNSPVPDCNSIPIERIETGMGGIIHKSTRY